MLEERRQKRLEQFLLKQEEKKLKLKLRKRKTKKKKKKVISNEETDIKQKHIKKRKVGRPKKRGPKKKRVRKKIIKVVKKRPVFDYKIVTMLNGKQNGHIGQYRTYAEAREVLVHLEEDNNNVIFPRKYLNKGNITLLKDEYLLLEKNRFGDKNDGVSRNEFGKFVQQKITNSDKWVVREKITRLVEESFWVYGYDPKTDRKTCQWIYDNLIIGSIENNYDIVRISIYKNKLIIKYDNKPLSMVMCKNKSDCIRMYNYISDNIRKKKLKQVICIGAYNTVCDARREIEREIMELTGWNKMKIQRSTN